MKRFLFFIITLSLSLPVFSQTKAEEYATRYALMVNKLGVTGVGVETLIKKWEADCPEDAQMLYAKFAYYYSKSQKTEIVQKDRQKFMGNSPVLALDDSTGAKVNFFEEIMFDDEVFALANQSLDKIIRLYPDDLRARINKINALLEYEKESPDMALQSLTSLIDYNYSTHPDWTNAGEAVEENVFESSVSDMCYLLYKIGSPASYEAFRSVSQHMLSYNPKNGDFNSNIGSYYWVYKQDCKTALKYYNKAIKLDPKNYSAVRNCVVMARRNKDAKLEKKYLPKLIALTSDPTEKASAEARLKVL